MPHPFLKPPTTVRLAGRTLIPVEPDASRRAAAQAVNANHLAAARFAFGHAALTPDTAIAAIEAGIMVPQPVQQQQAKARETAAEWGARMLAKRQPPRPVREDSPAMKAGLAIAAEAGRGHAERRIAIAAELGITEPLALSGRYSADPVPAPATAIDRAYADINALGGYVDRADREAIARDELLGEVLTILERHGARDLPAALLQVAA